MSFPLLEQYVDLLIEDDAYGGLDPTGGMPYGMHLASSEQLYNIFIRPFTDVVKVAAGKTAEMSQRTQALLATSVRVIATTLLPFLKASYGDIFAEEKHQIDRIRSEYAEVYAATWDAFMDHDILCAAFMYRPDLFMTAVFAKKAPKAAAKLLSILSGGRLDNVLSKLLKGNDHRLRGNGSPPKRGRGHGMGGSPFDDVGGPGLPLESLIREDDDKPKLTLASLMNNDKVKAVIAGSSLTQRLQAEGKSVVEGTVASLKEQIEDVLSANSLQELQTKLGKKIPGIEKLNGIDQSERRVAEEKLLAGTKAGMKEFYAKQLEGHVRSAIEAGVPENHPFITLYTKLISWVKGR